LPGGKSLFFANAKQIKINRSLRHLDVDRHLHCSIGMQEVQNEQYSNGNSKAI
jgi:hypothetical protein